MVRRRPPPRRSRDDRTKLTSGPDRLDKATETAEPAFRADRDCGARMHDLIRELYPICRSITGNGVRQTLDILRRHVPLTVHEVPSGTQVLDWTVPREWNVREAYIKDPQGAVVVDFRTSNLHVVGYSVPVRTKLPLRELREHLFTLPDAPDLVPYRTSYYREGWGFCMSQRQLDALPDGEYEVVIDATLVDGSLTYGEFYLPGSTEEEVLFSTHTCHPSLCNDNLSGIALTTFLAKHLSANSLRYSYRFLFLPATIGSITWLHRNRQHLGWIRHGLVVTCVGDPGRFTYKRSRRGDAEIDRVAPYVLTAAACDHDCVDFSPYGYDERQYCSPGFNLPIGSLTRSSHGRYSEYHTSADNLDLVRPECLQEAFARYLDVVRVLEGNVRYENRAPFGEPQLGKRGLYRTSGPLRDTSDEMAMLWVLNLSDGYHTLLDIAVRSGISFESIRRAADALLAAELLRPSPSRSSTTPPTFTS
jgi:aminopeptidase-like protein